MIFPALVFLGLKNNDCCGCCGNESCGKRFAMFSSILFAAIGFAGAAYCFVISAVAIHKGPKCPTILGWVYIFQDGRIFQEGVRERLAMIFPAIVFLGLKNNDCCGCCGNESCGRRFAMFSSILFAAIGFAGAGYCFVISAVAIHKGPKCHTFLGWVYIFQDGPLMGSSEQSVETASAVDVVW
ncbi:transmembrane 4 L6 family member 4 [Pelobates cultripes]|uniref:Transmembrane 4 L6 family member 4 n=1 Tax=Pelobates cultripes TaxID=61616 RepID=A0AAD1RB86_PELCU|nr:transmembrane 4 L6 family member 4 [Pelobates cultripes]